MMLPLLALCLPTVRSFGTRLAVVPIRQRSTVTLAGSLRDLLENKAGAGDGKVFKTGTMDINGQEKAAATGRPVSAAAAAPPARSAAQPVISISDSFDGGNAEFSGLKLVDGEEDFCDVHVTVKIRKDPYTELESKEHFQYFSFRSTLNRDAPAMKGLFQGKKSIKVKYILENAGKWANHPALVPCDHRAFLGSQSVSTVLVVAQVRRVTHMRSGATRRSTRRRRRSIRTRGGERTTRRSTAGH